MTSIFALRSWHKNSWQPDTTVSDAGLVFSKLSKCSCYLNSLEIICKHLFGVKILSFILSFQTQALMAEFTIEIVCKCTLSCTTCSQSCSKNCSVWMWRQQINVQDELLVDIIAFHVQRCTTVGQMKSVPTQSTYVTDRIMMIRKLRHKRACL